MPVWRLHFSNNRHYDHFTDTFSLRCYDVNISEMLPVAACRRAHDQPAASSEDIGYGGPRTVAEHNVKYKFFTLLLYVRRIELYCQSLATVVLVSAAD